MKLTAFLVLPIQVALLLWPPNSNARPWQNPMTQPPVGGDTLIAQKSPANLFLAEEPLPFTLTAHMQRLVRDRVKPVADSLSVKHPALLTYFDPAQGQVSSLPLSLMVRGNFRRNANNCEFPPLYLDFQKKKTKGTLFAKQNKLKLVTHCQSEDYVVREYLIYSPI